MFFSSRIFPFDKGNEIQLFFSWASPFFLLPILVPIKAQKAAADIPIANGATKQAAKDPGAGYSNFSWGLGRILDLLNERETCYEKQGPCAKADRHSISNSNNDSDARFGNGKMGSRGSDEDIDPRQQRTPLVMGITDFQ